MDSDFDEKAEAARSFPKQKIGMKAVRNRLRAAQFGCSSGV